MKTGYVVAVLFIYFGVSSDNIEDTYIGCYEVNPEGKGLSTSGGNYHFNLVDVKQCIAICQSLQQSYAACQAGLLCRCGSHISQMQNVSEEECYIRCSGEVLDMCGGSDGVVSIYRTEGAVKTHRIDDPGVIELYKPVTINSTLEDGLDGALYSYNWGDGIQSPFYTHHQSHVYVDDGVYLITINASNNISGPIEAQRNVLVESPVKDISAQCDRFVEVGFTFHCSSNFGQGTNVEITWNFGDDSEALRIHMSDAERFSVGPFIPQYIEQTESPLGFLGTYLVPGLSFDQAGKVEAWEVYAVSEGQVKLQIYRPLCGSQERYCAYNHTCLSLFLSCLPANEKACKHEEEAFCVKEGSCQPFHTSYFSTSRNITEPHPCLNTGNDTQLNNSILSNSSADNNITCDINATLWKTIHQWEPLYQKGGCLDEEYIVEAWSMGYTLVGENLVYLAEGYNIVTLEQSDRILIEPGDVLGFSPYQEKFPSYFPKAAYPLIGEVALKQDSDILLYLMPHQLHRSPQNVYTEGAVSILVTNLYLKARASSPSLTKVEHSYLSSGMFLIETEYNNALPNTFTGPSVTVASQYRILSIKGTQFTRDLGRYYACTDEAFRMSVEVLQGTFVRLIWTFADGRRNHTAPYLYNGIPDRPGVKTPDTQSFLFYEIGNYSTFVTAYNNVSSASVELETVARYRIKGLSGFIINNPQDNTTQGWNLTMAGTWFNFSSIITSGNEVEYIWTYGDTTNSGSWSRDTVYSHYFSDPGTYAVNIEADNIASTMTYSFLVKAVKPNMVYAPPYATTDIMFTAMCEVMWHTGRGLTFYWDMGDGTTYSIPSVNIVTHNYTTFNTYVITCTVLDFPHVSDSFSIIDQDPVEGALLDNITEVKATGDVVTFDVTWTRGNDVHFHWYFGEGEVSKETSEPASSHVYSQTGFYFVTVNVSNVVSWMMSPPLKIELQERVTSLRVASANNIIFTDVAAQVSYDTGNKVFFDYYFGDGFNITASTFSQETHRYVDPSLYTITVEAYNKVSSQTSQAVILIDSRITAGKLSVDTPRVRADLITADCWAMNGSSVKMTFDWGDGQVTGPYDAQFHGYGSYYEGTHYYSYEGLFTVTCYMENDWSEAVARTDVLLQEAISGLRFEPDVTVKGDIFHFEVPSFIGDSHDVLFYWDYNDGSYYNSDAFSHPYVYEAAGVYQVQLRATNLVSEMTVVQEVYVQEHVQDLYLSTVHPVVPGDPTVIAWQILYGTDVEYEVDLGDGTEPYVFYQSEVQKSWSLNYIYNLPGSYEITLTASNKLNSLNESATAHVEYPIQGLRAYTRGNSTTHTDKSAFIIIEIDQGTNVIYTCDYGDGSAPIITTKSFCRHMFIDLGHHLVSVFAENHLSTAFTRANQSYEVILPPIPQKIENLEIIVERSTILGDVTVFRMQRSRGNRYNCTWDFGDGNLQEMDQSMVFDLFNHTYEEVGTYEISLNCSNFYNPVVVAFACVTVQESVKGLNFSSPLIGEYHKNLTLTISLEAGTDASAEVYFNNGVFPVRVVGLAGIVTIPNRVVNVTGWQEIGVRAENMVPPELFVSDMIYIEAEVTNLRMWTDTPYITAGSSVTFKVLIDMGTDIHLQWHFGNNFVAESFISNAKKGESLVHQHLYVEEGLYAAMVIASNRISTVSVTPLLIVVEDPVIGFHANSSSPVIYPDGVINFNLHWNIHSRTLPDNTTIEIDWGAGEPPQSIPLDTIPSIQYFKSNGFCIHKFLEFVENDTVNGTNSTSYTSCDDVLEELLEYVDGSFLKVLNISNKYYPGKYDAAIAVQNMASRQVFEFPVETQVPVSSCVIHACSRASDEAECKPGGGPGMFYFALEVPAVFEVICSNGTGIDFYWTFGDGDLALGPEEEVAHQYHTPGSYTVNVVCGNVFGVENIETKIVVQESVVGLFISQGPTRQKDVSVIIFALQPGTDSTFYLSVPSLGWTDLVVTPPTTDPVTKLEAFQHWDQNAYVPFNISDVAMSHYEVSFPHPGSWNVLLLGRNFASEVTVEGFIAASKEPCNLPIVQILGASDNFRCPTSFLGYHEIRLMTRVELDCPATVNSQILWKVFHLQIYNDVLLPPDNSTSLDLPSGVIDSETSFEIDPWILPYGQFIAEVTVSLTNDGEVSNKQMAFFEVVPSDLVAQIAGGSEETVRQGSYFIIDGSESHDPDADPLIEDGDLSFTWYCHLGNESLHGEGTGCFGAGPGQVANGTNVLSYFTTNLTRYHEFIFTLTISKQGRLQASATKMIHVQESLVLPLGIRCLKNCLQLVNPGMEMILAANCDCQENATEVTFMWEVIGLDETEILTGQSSTGFLSSYFHLHPDAFINKTGEDFSVILTSRIGAQTIGTVRYTYHISDQLAQGDCVVTPTSGIALFTEFVIDCAGFATSYPPLFYRFLVSKHSQPSEQNSGSGYHLLSSSPDRQMFPQSLPVGLKDNNYTIYLRVQVTDAMGVTVSDYLEVEVLPPESTAIQSQISSIGYGNVSLLDEAIGKGDHQRATQIISELSASMNDDSSQGENKEKDSQALEEVRKNMVSTLADIKILNLELGRQTTSALSSVIAQPDEIDLNTQEKAVDIFSNVLSKVEAKGSMASDPESIQEISENFLKGASSLLQISSLQSSLAMELLQGEPLLLPPEALVSFRGTGPGFPRMLGVFQGQNETTAERKEYLQRMKKIKALTEQVLEMLEQVGGLLMQTEVPGDSPTTIYQSPTLMCALQKINSLDTRDQRYPMPDGSSLKLPAEGIVKLRDKAKKNEIIAQMYSFPTNPFTWHSSDVDILTSVVGLTLKDIEGNPLPLSDLTEDIEVFLPRGEYSALKFDTTTAYSDKLITLSFNVTEPSSSIHIDIHPTVPVETNKLEAYLRFGFWPSMNSYDLKTVLPLSKSELTVFSFNLTANFTPNPYTWFIPEDGLFATGSYYLGIRVVNENDDRNSSSTIEMDVDVTIYTARCLFWSPSYQSWLPDGCQVGGMTTSSFTHCLCSHLSFVGGTFSVPPKQQIFIKEEEVVPVEPLPSDLVFFISCGIAAAAVISILIGSCTDCISGRKLFNGMELRGDLYIVKVFTGLTYSATSTAQIFAVVHGEDSSSDPVLLTNEDAKAFSAGSVDSFLVPTAKNLGDIKTLTLWHSGRGYSPSWHLSRVCVVHYATNRQWHFLCNTWFNKSYRAKAFKASPSAERFHCRHLFATQSFLENISQRIPLFSLFVKPCFSSYSYKERACVFFGGLSLACCLTTVFKDILFVKRLPVSNNFEVDIDSVVHGGMIGGATLFIYHILKSTFTSVRPMLPKPPRSARYQETVQDEVKNVELKKVVKKSDSPGHKSPHLGVAEVSMNGQSMEKSTTSDQNRKDLTPGDKIIQSPSAPSRRRDEKLTSDESLEGWNAFSETDGESDHDWDTASDDNMNNSSNVTCDRSGDHVLQRGQNTSLDNIGRSSVDIKQLTSAPSYREVESIYRCKYGELAEALFGQHELPECDRALKEYVRDALPQNIDNIQEEKALFQLTSVRTETPTNFGASRHKKTVRRDPTVYSQYSQQMKIAAERQFDTSKSKFSRKFQETDIWNTSANNSNVSKEVRFQSPVRHVDTSCSLWIRVFSHVMQFSRRRFLPWFISILLLPLTFSLVPVSAFVAYYFTFQKYTLDMTYQWVTTFGVAGGIYLAGPLLLVCLYMFFLHPFQHPLPISEASQKFEHSYRSHSSRSRKKPSEVFTRAKLLITDSLIVSGTSIVMKILVCTLWLLYLLFLVYLALQRRSPMDFYATRYIKTVFCDGEFDAVHFEQISDFKEFWNWSETTLLPSLLSASHNRFGNEEPPLYRHLTVPRVRQQRVDPLAAEACRGFSALDLNATNCLQLAEETRQYLDSWDSPIETDVMPRQSQGYHYYRAEEVPGPPVTGKLASYHSGGYMVEIPPEPSTAQFLMDTLKQDLWLDSDTKAVMVEFVLHNAYVEFTCVIQLLLESAPTGYLLPSISIVCLHIEHYEGPRGRFHQSLEGLVVLSAILLLFKELKSLYRNGGSYYRSLEGVACLVTLVSVGWTASTLVLYRMSLTNITLTNPDLGALTVFSTASFRYTCALGVAIFMVLTQQTSFFRLLPGWSHLHAVIKHTIQGQIVSSPLVAVFLFTSMWVGGMLFSGTGDAFQTHLSSLTTLASIKVGHIPDTGSQDKLEQSLFYMVHITILSFVSLLAFSVVAMQTYSSSRILHALVYFIQQGRLTDLARKLKSRIIVGITLGKVREKKRKVVRQLRHWRNQQPVEKIYLRKLNLMNKKAAKLLQTYQEENEFLFGNTSLLVEVSLKKIEEWKRSR